jgi:ribose transport system permease protein
VPLRLFTADTLRVIAAYGAAVLLFVIGGVVHPGFASFASVTTILLVASFVGLVAAGQCFVILVGGIDLSVPWVLNAAAILIATASLGEDSRALYAILLTLGAGGLAGLVNGVLIVWFGVPAVVTTLAMNGIVEGLALGLSGGMTCGACASYAPPVVAAAVHGVWLGVPVALWLWLAVLALVTFALNFTRFGRATYAIGNNPRAAFLAGVNVKLVTASLYVLSGLFSALAGILLVGFGGQASLGMGEPYLFQSIAAVVIGGVSILGGRGQYLGAAAGAVSLTALVSVLLALDMPDYGRSIVYGVVILALLLLYGREQAE